MQWSLLKKSYRALAPKMFACAAPCSLRRLLQMRPSRHFQRQLGWSLGNELGKSFWNLKSKWEFSRTLPLPRLTALGQKWDAELGCMEGWQPGARHATPCSLPAFCSQSGLWQPVRRNGSATSFHTVWWDRSRPWCYMSKVTQDITSSANQEDPGHCVAKSVCFYSPWHKSWATTAPLTSEQCYWACISWGSHCRHFRLASSICTFYASCLK